MCSTNKTQKIKIEISKQLKEVEKLIGVLEERKRKALSNVRFKPDGTGYASGDTNLRSIEGALLVQYQLQKKISLLLLNIDNKDIFKCCECGRELSEERILASLSTICIDCMELEERKNSIQWGASYAGARKFSF